MHVITGMCLQVPKAQQNFHVLPVLFQIRQETFDGRTVMIASAAIIARKDLSTLFRVLRKCWLERTYVLSNHKLIDAL